MNDGDYYQPPPKSPVPAAVIAAVITSVAVYFALRVLDERGAFSAFLRPTAAPVAAGATPVEIPSVLGMRPEQARELLRGRDLLLAFSVEKDSGQYPAGTIAEQVPLPGSQLPKGGTVQAVLSRGLKQVAIPRVAGLKADDAVKQLATAGLVAGPQKPVASDTVAAGLIIETEPAIGTALPAQGSVILVVSTGASAKPVPKVTGLRLRAARDALEQAGFKVGKVRYDSDGDLGSGQVLVQKPPAATMSPPGTPIDLVVNED